MVGSNLLRYHQGGFLPFDTEGESLNVLTTRPWQIAWGLADLKKIHWVKTRWIWWKDLRMSKGAAIKTRFDPATYKAKAQPAAEVWAEFKTDLHNPQYRILWQGGLGYDVYAVRNWERALGLVPDESYLIRTIDTNPILKAQAKGWTPDTSSPEEFLAWSYKAMGYIEKGLKTNLTDVGKARKIDHDYANTHDAANDIQLMWKIFKDVVYQVEV